MNWLRKLSMVVAAWGVFALAGPVRADETSSPPFDSAGNKEGYDDEYGDDEWFYDCYEAGEPVGAGDPDDVPIELDKPGSPWIIDNDTPGFSVVAGNWIIGAGDADYYRSSHRYHSPAARTNVVSWTFNNLLPGAYSVAATWVPHGNRATTVPYTITSGTNKVAMALNQREEPDDLTAHGAKWEVLGTPFAVPTGSTSLTVRMTADRTGYAIADAVRLEYLGPLMPDERDDDREAAAPATPVER